MTEDEEVKTITPEEQRKTLEGQYSLSHPGVFNSNLLMILQDIAITLHDLKTLLEGPKVEVKK